MISQELGSKYHNSYYSRLLEILQFCNPCLSINQDHLLKINIGNFGNTKLNHLQSLTFTGKLNTTFHPKNILT